VDRCLDRPGAKAKQAREPPVGRATSLNSSAESKCVLGTSPLAHAADEGDVHSRVSATTGVNSGDACVDSDKGAKAAPGWQGWEKTRVTSKESRVRGQVSGLRESCPTMCALWGCTSVESNSRELL